MCNTQVEFGTAVRAALGRLAWIGPSVSRWSGAAAKGRIFSHAAGLRVRNRPPGDCGDGLPAAERPPGPTDAFEIDDVHEFEPAEPLSYYRKGEGFETEDTEYGRRIVDPAPLSTVYPHADILNTKAFLQRYPTTATKPQPGPVALELLPLPGPGRGAVGVADHGSRRARRHQCVLILPVDVSEWRTHCRCRHLDHGRRRTRCNPEATLRAWVPGYFDEHGDTWYRDMREPGFDGELAPHPDHSQQWLAARGQPGHLVERLVHLRQPPDVRRGVPARERPAAAAAAPVPDGAGLPPLPHQPLKVLERQAGRGDQEAQHHPLAALAEAPVPEPVRRA